MIDEIYALVTARCDNAGYDTSKPRRCHINAFRKLWKDCHLHYCWPSSN